MADEPTRAKGVTNWFENSPILGPLIGLGTCVSAVIAFVLLLNNFGEKFWPKPMPVVFADCKYIPRPTKLTAGERPRLLVLGPPNLDGTGLHDLGEIPASWADVQKPNRVYRCELTNQATEVLFRISIPVHLRLTVPEILIDGYHPGKIFEEQVWVIKVPKLEPTAPFVFYIANDYVPKYIKVSLPGIAVAGELKIQIVQPEDNLRFALDPLL